MTWENTAHISDCITSVDLGASVHQGAGLAFQVNLDLCTHDLGQPFFPPVEASTFHSSD